MSGPHHHAHDHGHGHGHGHGRDDGHVHGHHHAPPDRIGRAFAIGIAINTVYVLVEAGYGFSVNSMALLADAGHNAGDVVSLMVAWGAAVLARRQATARLTYGLGQATVLGALFNAVLLLVAVGMIALEAVRRLVGEPAEVPGLVVIVVALVGVLVNGATALLLLRDRDHDINVRGAYLHMAADAAISLGAALSGAAILLTGWHWVDPAFSLVVVAVIFQGSWRLLRESTGLALHGVPAGIDVEQVRDWLLHRPGVTGVHDLHIWPLGTTETALTCHLVMPAGQPADAFLAGLAHDLEHEFRIGHVTVQVERGDGALCKLANAHAA